MNQVFKPFFRKFVIVFFDDILVYSRSLTEHVTHLQLVLQCFVEHNFFSKGRKCQFLQQAIKYLGHLVSSDEVKADRAKIEAMTSWPQPTNRKQLSGFLGLTGYYCCFVVHYATITAPLTVLFKKDHFYWTAEETKAFVRLKQVMIETLVLRLPDFSKTFVMETDASSVGIGGVLM
ncbi:uncharacterized mitochondrial protein AtMg00860-like [Ziziphus jujuba]|uniref:Uncharacterized mitochondrial protein AtMg00860-like n=1 Tax=Ziziphus jujuba TaxID=326968 RepID=A0ABM3ZX96_ZIZJJ|nr:uncharacterized mitochondrial protein AtMg00860-like [Ziziphus jujuba]